MVDLSSQFVLWSAVGVVTFSPLRGMGLSDQSLLGGNDETAMWRGFTTAAVCGCIGINAKVAEARERPTTSFIMVERTAKDATTKRSNAKE